MPVGFATGSRFKLTKYPRQDQNWEYLILAADYQLQSDAFGSSGETGTGPVFQCWFTDRVPKLRLCGGIQQYTARTDDRNTDARERNYSWRLSKN